jgi:hypothetical protein
MGSQQTVTPRQKGTINPRKKQYDKHPLPILARKPF